MNAPTENNQLNASMFIRIILTTVLLCFSAQTLATFEIKDPAAEFNEQKQGIDNPLGNTSCIDFLRDGADESGAHAEKLAWLRQVYEGWPQGAELQESMKAYCIDHPKQSLRQAAAALGAVPAD